MVKVAKHALFFNLEGTINISINFTLHELSCFTYYILVIKNLILVRKIMFIPPQDQGRLRAAGGGATVRVEGETVCQGQGRGERNSGTEPRPRLVFFHLGDV